MTQAPDRSALAFRGLDEAAEAIRKRGGRLSTARRLVLEALFAAEGPVSAEYIAAGMNGEITPLEVSSVYRNLRHLEELGVVQHVHIAHGPGLYALETPTRLEYVVCERCDRVETVDAERLDRVRDAIRAETGYEARFSHFPIVGLCAACAAQATSSDHDHAHHAHDHGDAHDHAQTPHEHQHSHGDFIHSHPH